VLGYYSEKCVGPYGQDKVLALVRLNYFEFERMKRPN